MSKHFDIIGDIHGHADALRRLLTELGYHRHGDGFRHRDRTVLFVGDFIDRGPAIADVLRIVRATIDAGDGLAVMGNHEFNAIAFHTCIPGTNNRWFRERSSKNCHQHKSTLDQLSANELSDAVAWFSTLPVAIEIDGVRVVHAAWQASQIEIIRHSLQTFGRFTVEFLSEAMRPSRDLHAAIENVLKGPELALPAGRHIVDKSGQKRNTVRVKWYEAFTGQTCRDFHLGSDDVPDVTIDSADVHCPFGYPPDAAPVFMGHYWLTGTPNPLASNVACTDYSVAKGGKLVAYRWDGESELSSKKFCWVSS
ncbi:metallophosphoesterase [Crateriforma conspicua]|uniref:metallophosphoesterase n=1 Tax=Crateriforma conspicua TaxID=2527996 RepID=UPI00118A37E3|nr:metallophosphoesterase [Crateriforma conspicua]QDV63996.1 Bis(5'-nucleosyl)-tetraphosphatase PrpE [asymmetrical] [Crateriforma conspicua]